MPSVKMLYGGYTFLPAPVFTESVEMVRKANLDQEFARVTREFTGTLLNPSASGNFRSLFDKKEQLKAALASGQQEFKIIHDGSTIVSEFPRINGPVFAEGIWVNRIDYTFSMETDDPIDDDVQSFTESWNFDEAEDNSTVAVQHDLNAVGINTGGSGVNNAFVNAKAFVLGKAGFINAASGAPFFAQVSGVAFDAYEELRSEQHDPQQGSFGISERFILSSGNFIHTQTAQFASDNNGVVTISLNGVVRGLGRKGFNTGYPRAVSAFKTRVRPKFPAVASGVYIDFDGGATLFTANSTSQSITRNQFAGTIDYSVAFSDSPSENLPSGILDFSISVQEQDAIRLFASFPIMDRNLGPVVQDVGTSNEGSFTVQGNVVGKPGFPFADLLAFVEDQVNLLRPNPIDFQTLRPASKQVTKDTLNRTVNFNVSWTFTKELSQVFTDGGAPVVID